MSYTTRQRKAIEDYGRHQLICAIPGSGKTHTSVGMVQHILEHEPQSRVLLVTFTNAATDEMRQRLQKRLPGKVKQFAVSTFTRLMSLNPLISGACFGRLYWGRFHINQQS